MFQPSLKNVVSQGSAGIDGLNHSPTAFYNEIARRLAARSIPGLTMSRVELRQGGVMSEKRLCLRVRLDKDVFDICASHTSGVFFVSWYLSKMGTPILDLIYRIPFVSWFAFIYDRLIRPTTYSSLDQGTVFRSLVQTAVSDLMDELRAGQGHRAHAPDEQGAIIRGHAAAGQ